jgi:hypothetical protein
LEVIGRRKNLSKLLGFISLENWTGQGRKNKLKTYLLSQFWQKQNSFEDKKIIKKYEKII